MQIKFITHQKSCRRLILIFAGWAMDWRPFRRLHANGYNIAVVWNYRELTCNWSPLVEAYDEICVLAWSFGVFAASATMHELLPRVTKRVAVNGTLTPIDADRGIHPEIFRATLAGMSPNNLKHFYRSMFVGKDEYDAFRANAPHRDIEDAIAELADLEMHATFHAPQVCEWDLAVIAEHDRIFVPSAQETAWRGLAAIRRMNTGHKPDFQTLIDRIFIDKELVATRFACAQDSYADKATVQHEIARRLHALLTQQPGGAPVDGNLIEIGVGSGTLTALYAPDHRMGTVALWDIAGIPPQVSAAIADARPEQCDAELRIRRQPSASAAFILSTGTLQWFNSPKAFLHECSRVLIPGGWLAISTFANGNLHELASVLGSGLEVPSGDAWQTMFPDDLEVTVRTEEELTLTLDSPREVLRYLSHTGANAVRYGRSPVVLARHILDAYPRDNEGRCPMTFRPVYIIARKV